MGRAVGAKGRGTPLPEGPEGQERIAVDRHHNLALQTLHGFVIAQETGPLIRHIF